LVRELNFAGGLYKNPYKHLQDFEEICATLMISGMNHETLKWEGLKFEPTRQDLEEFMASKEKLVELSAIISRNWSTTIEEDNSYIQIYPDSKTVCCCLQGFLF
jgi:hypothetical protein